MAEMTVRQLLNNDVDHETMESATTTRLVFFSTDDEYAVPTYIAAYSMLHNLRCDAKVLMCIMVPEDFSDEAARLLRSLTDSFEAVDLRIIDMGNEYDSAPLSNPRITVPTLYRLSIPRVAAKLAPWAERCVYLDSDLVVEGDICELFEEEVDGFCAGGVRDRLLSGNGAADIAEALGVPTARDYVNAGVLLFNLVEIERLGLAPDLEMAGWRDNLPYNDQDAVNYVFYGRIRLLPLRFNVNTACLGHSRRMLREQYGAVAVQEARWNPLIVHFNTWIKPWMFRHMPLGNRWWRYVSMQNERILREYVHPFLSAHRLPPHVEMLETAKSISKYFDMRGRLTGRSRL